MRITLFLLLITSLSHADDIYLKNGCILRNVTIVQTSGKIFVYKTSSGEMKQLDPEMLDHYERKALNAESSFENCKPVIPTQKTLIKKQVRMDMLLISASAIALSIDYFIETSDMSEDIDDFERLGFYDKTYLNRMKGVKNRKAVMGDVFAVVAVFGLLNMYEDIEVKPTTNGLSLSYSF